MRGRARGLAVAFVVAASMGCSYLLGVSGDATSSVDASADVASAEAETAATPTDAEGGAAFDAEACDGEMEAACD